ncbi:alpha/beta fold hydrolase [Halovenus marina]|uniref:alpha/beta hydrolase n=1 Tax=Halovenus marina TaxID=3396621 RepID=UPI003F554BA8
MSDGPRSLSRRTYLAAVAALTTSVAGCSDTSVDDPPESGTDRPPLGGAASIISDDAESSERDPGTATEVANALVETMAAGDFEAAYDSFADSVRSQISPGSIEMIWFGYTAVGGPYVETVTAEASGLGTVDMTLAFEAGEHSMRVSTNDQGDVRGVFISDDYESPEYVDEAAFESQTAQLETPGCGMGATVTKPATSNDVPGAVIVHGSDPQGIADRNLDVGGTQMYRDIGEGLASRGIATFRYDRRTYACSNSVTPAEYTIDAVSVDDALAAIERFRRVDGVDPDRIYVVGHSLGAMAAPRIARRDGRLAGFVALASPARPFKELTLDQLHHQATVGEYENEQIMQQYELWRDRLEQIQAGEYVPEQTYVGYPGALWNSLAAYQHIETARELDVPMFFLQGSRDFRVTIEDDFPILRDELGEKPDAAFAAYEELNHGFFPGEGPSVPQETIVRNNVDPAVIADIASWIAGERSQFQQRVQAHSERRGQTQSRHVSRSQQNALTRSQQTRQEAPHNGYPVII